MSDVERRPRGLVAGRLRAWWVSRAAPARPGRSAGFIEAPDPALCREWQACSGFQLSAEKPLGYAQLNEGLRLMATCDLVQILLRASA